MANDNYYDDATVAGWSLNGTGWNAMAAFIDKVRLGTLTASLISDFDTEVSNNTDVAANTSYRGVGHLPLAGGTLSGDLDLGSGAIIDFADTVADKIHYYSNQYGVGIESSYVTRWGSSFRYRIGGTSASTGTEVMTLTGSAVDFQVDMDMNDKTIDNCYRVIVQGGTSNNGFLLQDTAGGGFHGDGTNVYFGAGGGNIYFRPNSRTSGTAQGYYSSSGDFYAARNVLYAGQAYSAINTLTDGATITPDWNNGDTQTVTLGGNRTIANPSNSQSGATYTIIIKQDATGSRTVTWGSNYKWSGGTAPTLSTGANAVDIITFVSDGTNLYGVAQLDFS